MACGALSLLQKRPLTLAEVISKVPLSRVASFIRAITDSVDSNTLEKQMAKNARARDKLKLHKTLDVSKIRFSFLIQNRTPQTVCYVLTPLCCSGCRLCRLF
jgi:hypothetical protein